MGGRVFLPKEGPAVAGGMVIRGVVLVTRGPVLSAGEEEKRWDCASERSLQLPGGQKRNGPSKGAYLARARQRG